MSTEVDEIRNVVLLFSNPSWINSGTIPSTVIRNITALSSQIAYSDHIRENVTILAAKSTSSVNGLLYVPDLPAGDPCVKQTEPFVPNAAVRRANLPPTNYNLVALAPWVNSACSKKYMTSANTDPIRAFIFYRPGNSSAEPPPPSSPAWDLNGSTRWKAQSSYPVFAVSGVVGQEMMRQLGLYSGNVTEVPFGQNISDAYDPDPDDYIRIWTDISLSTPSALFGIWVYFLIVIAVLLTIISATSLLMHLAQSRRRASLRRRVISGEVDLEAMGIKRLTVPMAEIQKFPLYTYHYEPPATSPPLSPHSPASPRSFHDAASNQISSDDVGTANTTQNALGARHTPSVATDYQPVCSICLEPFENRLTVIREIRCGHIFHPECIDEFLSENSSLCPLCKANMLPPGYCPRVTNAMVRREQAVRRLRHNGIFEEAHVMSGRQRRSSILAAKVSRRHAKPQQSSIPMDSKSPPPPIDIAEAAEQARKPNQSPVAWLRARMRELAGSVPDEENDFRMSKWQRMRVKVFPGF
ncbi:hypothetical protein QBC47DRAFT_383126 [Echria macrotheca]|uniref:RING-type E3 ubiquitin transferase n=1 Tax=Echria macrotheca TaxID=438768 RepID=A0AAJ0F638_9PEZI|nr:hypothetical protein QBC47DRAFT_383126 [Echria macrotheca]